MENRRYDYQPITTRPRIRWANDARIAVWVSPNIEYFHIDQPIPNFGTSRVPDVRGYSQRDYGARVGVFRMMEVLDKHGIRASAQLNSECCIHHREIIDEGVKRDWEWLGTRHHQQPAPDLLSARGRALRRTAGARRDRPGHRQGAARLAGTGARGNLRHPGPPGQRGLRLPLRLGLRRPARPHAGAYRPNDRRALRAGAQRHQLLPALQLHAQEYLQQVCDQFDVLYRDGERSGTVMCLPLHPFIIGVPLRIKYFDLALEYIRSHDGVWLTTGGEIADWYYQHYYEDPGRP